MVLFYLEWIRAKRMRTAKTARTRAWWSRQRTHGLCLAVRGMLGRKATTRPRARDRNPRPVSKNSADFSEPH